MASLTKHWLPAYEIQRHKRADIHFVEARVGISKKVASAERLEIYTGQCVRVPPSNLQQWREMFRFFCARGFWGRVMYSSVSIEAVTTSRV